MPKASIPGSMLGTLGLQVVSEQQPPNPSSPNAKSFARIPTSHPPYPSGTLNPVRKGSSWLVSSIAIAVLVTAVVVGGAIGGGLGAALAKCKNNLQTAISSITPTTCNGTNAGSNQSTYATTTSGLILNYVAEPPARVYNIATSCENIPDHQIHLPSSGFFSVYCNKDIGWGGVAKQTGPKGENLSIVDILGSISYSLSDCIQSCAVFNSKAETFGRAERCRGVAFASKLNNVVAAYQANCWLKNGSVISVEDMVDQDGSVSAVLELEQV